MIQKQKKFACLVLCAGIFFALRAEAIFLGPPAGSNPPSGGGLLNIDTSRNINFGGTGAATITANLDDGTPLERLFMVAGNQNPGVAIRNLQTGKTYVLMTRNNNHFALWDGGVGQVRLFVDGDGNVGVGQGFIPLDKVHVAGNARATNFIGNMQARYVTSDVFGGPPGAATGNFAFPSGLAVGSQSTAGLPVGGLYVVGDVGIGASPTPGAKLEVAGQIKITGGSPGAGKVLTSDSSGLASWAMLIPAGTAGQTLRYDGTSWIANSVLFNNGANIGIGTPGPNAKLEVSNTTETQIRISSPAGAERKIVFFDNATPPTKYNFEIAEQEVDNALFIGPSTAVGGTVFDTAKGILVRADGFVGIGTTIPLAKLNIGSGHRSITFQPNLGGSGVYGAAIGVGTTIDTSVSPNRITINADSTVPNATYNAGVLLTMGVGGTEPYLNLYVIPRSGSGPRTIDAPSPQLSINPSTLSFTGSGRFTGTVIVAPPNEPNEAATKGYVDTLVSGGGGGAGYINAHDCSRQATCNMQSATFPGTLSANITGVNQLNAQRITVNKINVQTIDPLYEINGKKYATYVASFAGGVKEEYVGKGKLSYKSNKTDRSNMSYWTYTLDFSEVERGSDLWLWRKAIDFSKDNVEVFATPYGVPAVIFYEINGETIIFTGDREAEFSYRLIGRRFDWQSWPTYAKDQKEHAGFVIK